jgi:hypothetical protein
MNQARHEIDDLHHIQRLRYVLLEACLHRAATMIGTGVRRESHRRQRAAVGNQPYSAKQLVAIGVRHSNVADDHVRALSAYFLQRFRHGLRRCHLGTRPSEHRAQELQCVRMVIDDEDPLPLQPSSIVVAR